MVALAAGASGRRTEISPQTKITTVMLVWNLLKRAPDRIVAAVLAQPSGSRPGMRDLFFEGNMKDLGFRVAQVPARHHDGDGGQIPDQDVPHQLRLRLYRDARFRAQLPDARIDPAG